MRILLVQPNEQLSHFIKRGLTEASFAIDAVRDGRSGIEFAATYDYDLIILDFILPDLTGRSLLHKLRSQNASVAILTLTHAANATEVLESFELGADDCLTKPFLFAELLARVKALLRRRLIPRRDMLRVADLELDPNEHFAARGGKRLQLTGKEFAILECLMLRSGRVLSRTVIIEHVWNQNFEGLHRTVDVYVCSLRSKVDGSYEKKLIRTIHGTGYMIGDGE